MSSPSHTEESDAAVYIRCKRDRSATLPEDRKMQLYLESKDVYLISGKENSFVIDMEKESDTFGFSYYASNIRTWSKDKQKGNKLVRAYRLLRDAWEFI